jgi:hypothetical protein
VATIKLFEELKDVKASIPVLPVNKLDGGMSGPSQSQPAGKFKVIADSLAKNFTDKLLPGATLLDVKFTEPVVVRMLVFVPSKSNNTRPVKLLVITVWASWNDPLITRVQDALGAKEAVTAWELDIAKEALVNSNENEDVFDNIVHEPVPKNEPVKPRPL